MNLHWAGHNIQLNIKGTIMFYIFTTGQLYLIYKMISQSYIFTDVKQWLLSGENPISFDSEI